LAVGIRCAHLHALKTRSKKREAEASASAFFGAGHERRKNAAHGFGQRIPAPSCAPGAKRERVNRRKTTSWMVLRERIELFEAF